MMLEEATYICNFFGGDKGVAQLVGGGSQVSAPHYSLTRYISIVT